MEIRTVKNNMVVVRSTDGLTLFSYDTKVANWYGDTLTLSQYWDYSNTTLKHLYCFIEEYVFNGVVREILYKSNKKAYVNKLIEDDLVCVKEL